MVKGFIQTYDIDYNETFASVIKPQSYKAIFAYTTALDCAMEMINVTTAFFMERLKKKSILFNQLD